MQGDETYFKIMSKNVNIANCSFILLLSLHMNLHRELVIIKMIINIINRICLMRNFIYALNVVTLLLIMPART